MNRRVGNLKNFALGFNIVYIFLNFHIPYTYIFIKPIKTESCSDEEITEKKNQIITTTKIIQKH